MVNPHAAAEGFHDPLYCPRGRTDCKSLAQIIGVDHRSFVCCGENDGNGVNVATDHYRFCHKTEDGVDAMMNHDQRDMAHIAAVYSWALAAVIAVDAGHEAPRTLHRKAPDPEHVCGLQGFGQFGDRCPACEARRSSTTAIPRKP